MPYRVLYSPRAQSHLISLERYLARRGSPENAKANVEAIAVRCDRIALAPFQGSQCDGLLSGLRTTGFRGRVTIAFRITAETVIIAGIFYAGRSVKFDR